MVQSFTFNIRIINLYWPDQNYTWQGDFSFELNIFRKCDVQTYKRIMTKTSSEFSIISKPSVYLKRKRNEMEEKKPKKKGKNSFYQETTTAEVTDLFLQDHTVLDFKKNVDIFTPTKLLSLSFSQDENNHPFYDSEEQTCSLSCKETM
jgi:hypothetical protein